MMNSTAAILMIIQAIMYNAVICTPVERDLIGRGEGGAYSHDSY